MRPFTSAVGWTGDPVQVGMLEHLPCAAMVLTSITRRVIYANAIARAAGASAGQTCYESMARRDSPCVHCQAADAWSEQATRKLETNHGGTVRDSRWVPLTKDVYVHYISGVAGTMPDLPTPPTALPEHASAHTAVARTTRRGRLTGQERRVLQLIAEGHTNREVAGMLRLSVNTIHTHRTSLMAKLDIHKQADLVRYAIRTGLAQL